MEKHRHGISSNSYFYLFQIISGHLILNVDKDEKIRAHKASIFLSKAANFSMVSVMKYCSINSPLFFTLVTVHGEVFS